MSGNHIPRKLVVPSLVLAVAAMGCSFSKSSGSLSDSVSTSIKSVSNSSSKSSGGESRQSYRDDVRDYTASFVKSGGAIGDFRSGLGNVASRHKVSDWEGDEATFVAIGEGLARAGAGRAVVDAYKASLAAGSSTNADAIERGYSSTGK